MQRIIELDIFRGWAIFLMILFHLSYDLNYFQFIHINMHQETFWVYARYLIVSMFLITVGMSLALVHRPKIKWDKMRKRTLYLGIASLLVSVGSYIQFPNTWIYFGILHFILVASWVALIFIPYPKITLATFFLILLGSYLGVLHSHALFSLLQSPLHLPARHTEDLVIFFPWFAVILLGILLIQYSYAKPILKYLISNKRSKINVLFSFMGRHSLILYLIHQPILLGILFLFKNYLTLYLYSRF